MTRVSDTVDWTGRRSSSGLERQAPQLGTVELRKVELRDGDIGNDDLAGIFVVGGRPLQADDAENRCAFGLLT